LLLRNVLFINILNSFLFRILTFHARFESWKLIFLDVLVLLHN